MKPKLAIILLGILALGGVGLFAYRRELSAEENRIEARRLENRVRALHQRVRELRTICTERVAYLRTTLKDASTLSLPTPSLRRAPLLHSWDLAPRGAFAPPCPEVSLDAPLSHEPFGAEYDSRSSLELREVAQAIVREETALELSYAPPGVVADWRCERAPSNAGPAGGDEYGDPTFHPSDGGEEFETTCSVTWWRAETEEVVARLEEKGRSTVRHWVPHRPDGVDAAVTFSTTQWMDQERTFDAGPLEPSTGERKIASRIAELVLLRE